MGTASRIPSGGPKRLGSVAVAAALPWAVVLLVWYASGFGFLSLLEWRSVDLRFLIRGPLEPDPEVVIVAMDEDTFRRLRLRYPFPPVVYADLIRRLDEAGAAAILFDFLFSEPSRECDPPGQDEILAESVGRAGNVVWAIELEGGERPVDPVPVIREAAAALGYINLPDEVDSRVRRFRPEASGRNSFALAGLLVYAGFVPEAWRGSGLRLINFRGGSGTFPYVSMADLLEGRADPALIRNRICLVGATFAASHDVYATPYHRTHRADMPGVEIHANIIGNLLRGDALDPDRGVVQWGTLLVLCLGISALLILERVWWSLSLWFAASLGWSAWAMERFLHGSVVLLVPPLVALAGTFWLGAFYAYLSERDRRRAIRRLFGHYVDPSVITWLLKNPESVQQEGIRRMVTILDTDIEGFTAITEKMDPSALVSRLNTYFEEVTQAAIEAGGMHDKFKGDALMVIFGFPMEQPDHALRALRAAREILRRLEVLNREWERRGLQPFRTRIGISSGEVVMGNVGGTKRKSFTAMGDAANMAARLEGLNKNYGTRVLLDDSTASLLPRDIPLRDLGEAQIRGYSRPVRLFNPAFDEPPPESRH